MRCYEHVAGGIIMTIVALPLFPANCLGFINSSGYYSLLHWTIVLSNWTYLIDVQGSLKADAYRFVGSQSISLAYASPV